MATGTTAPERQRYAPDNTKKSKKSNKWWKALKPNFRRDPNGSDKENNEKASITTCGSTSTFADSGIEMKRSTTSITNLHECKNIQIGSHNAMIVIAPEVNIFMDSQHVSAAEVTKVQVEVHLSDESLKNIDELIKKINESSITRFAMSNNDYGATLTDVRRGSIVLTFEMPVNSVNHVVKDVENQAFADWLSTVFTTLDLGENQELRLNVTKVEFRTLDTTKDVDTSEDVGLDEVFTSQVEKTSQAADVACAEEKVVHQHGGGVENVEPIEANKKKQTKKKADQFKFFIHCCFKPFFHGTRRKSFQKHQCTRPPPVQKCDSMITDADSGIDSAHTTVTSSASLIKPTGSVTNQYEANLLENMKKNTASRERNANPYASYVNAVVGDDDIHYGTIEVYIPL